MRRLLWILAAASAACGTAPPLEQQLADLIAAVPGAAAGVFVHDLENNRTVAINADSAFHAASTMKVPVMIEYFRAIDAGRMAPDSTIELHNTFASIVDQSPYSLDAGADSDSALYADVGSPVPVRNLVDRMITRSSNLATNAVIELLGASNIQATAESLGAKVMQVRRGVEDGKAFAQGLNNTTAARDLGALLEAIVNNRAADSAGSSAMLDILERQEFNDEIPAGLPAGTRVAHKTGQITAVLHDAAIIFPPNRRPIILVVLTGGIPDERIARALIQDVARTVWHELVSAK